MFNCAIPSKCGSICGFGFYGSKECNKSKHKTCGDYSIKQGAPFKWLDGIEEEYRYIGRIIC